MTITMIGIKRAIFGVIQNTIWTVVGRTGDGVWNKIVKKGHQEKTTKLSLISGV